MDNQHANDIDINPCSSKLVSSRNVRITEIPYPGRQPLSTGVYQHGQLTYRQLFKELGLAFYCVAECSREDLGFGCPLDIDAINRVSLYQPGSSLGIIARDCSPDILDTVVLPGVQYYIFEHFREYCDFENENHPGPSDERSGRCCALLELDSNSDYLIQPTARLLRRGRNAHQVTEDPKVAHVVPLMLDKEFESCVQNAINPIRRERGLPEIEDDEPAAACQENTLVLLPDEVRLFESYLWTVEPETLTIRTMVPLDSQRIVNGSSINSVIAEEDRKWSPPPGVFGWHFEQAILRSYRAGGIVEPYDGEDEDWSEEGAGLWN
ncbi:hypothetical protein FN846DRAFT_910766 [Sphaerosporella brunnea]|uniref:Uncharacterized protein n=1 Tax=Sphaerosporella brunnea TaxID=1250544 RepID=A0A5J5ENL9_9PEZI|nr:hypothetical protein FN846DRAFT_910766 [Sphaerosporella brunnea]